jgi:hypothetical protein
MKFRGCLVYAQPSHAKSGARQFFGEGFARPDLASEWAQKLN